MSKRQEYPNNVCIHGNGFVQVSLGGEPHETRIHIWHPELPSRVQTVNTSTHNHRFGFTSTVLRGVVEQDELEVHGEEGGDWTMWTAGHDRLSTGNRELVLQPGRFVVRQLGPYRVQQGRSYWMPPRMFHRTNPVTSIAVTLMTKTVVLPTEEYQASVLCADGTEPDQVYNRFQMPWEELVGIITECLEGTVFEGTAPWR